MFVFIAVLVAWPSVAHAQNDALSHAPAPSHSVPPVLATEAVVSFLVNAPGTWREHAAMTILFRSTGRLATNDIFRPPISRRAARHSCWAVFLYQETPGGGVVLVAGRWSARQAGARGGMAG